MKVGSTMPFQKFLEKSSKALNLDLRELSEILRVPWQDAYRWKKDENLIPDPIRYKIGLLSNWIELLESQINLHNVPALVRMCMFDGLSLLQILKNDLHPSIDEETILQSFRHENQAIQKNLKNLTVRANIENNDSWLEDHYPAITFKNPIVI